MPASSLVLVSIGNTRTRFASAVRGKLEPSQVLTHDHVDSVADAIRAALSGAQASGGDPTVAIASVNDPIADRLETALTRGGPDPVSVLRFGRDMPIPILNALADDSTVGQDRLLDALGAFARSGQACIVIDAGTAVTVDFVDGEGVFQGGAIAPGMAMMFKALHEHTAALPLVTAAPELIAGVSGDPSRAGNEGGEGESDAAIAGANALTPFGKDTRSAIAIGVASSLRGLVHLLVDKYAEFYEAYPRVIATGGDAPMLFEHDPIVEAIVPDLTLIGMLAAVQKLEELDGEEE